MLSIHVGSLRRRFFLAVLFCAVLPLATAGWWLANSAVRSAEGLLRAQLDTSLATITAGVERRWTYRHGDLLLIAGNEITRRTVASRANATADDSAFMAPLYASVESTIPSVTVRAADGTVRWTFMDSSAAGVRNDPLLRDSLPLAPRIALVLPIRTPEGRAIGELAAEVRLDALLPVDSIPLHVSGARLSIADASSGRMLSSSGARAAPRDRDAYSRDGMRWIVVRRVLDGPSLEIAIEAPTASYVGPFERTATVGILVLVVVTVGVLALSVFFAGRLTGSLERLADAADAAAAGQLEQNVVVGGGDEVGRVAHSFNTMLDSLRHTLEALARREALAAVGEFAASLSHEVRNSLTAVRVDLQRVEEGTLPPDKAAELVSRTLRNVQRLDTAVTGGLAVARSGNAKMQVIDLRRIVGAAATAAERTFTSAGGRLVMQEGAASPCLVRGDASALEQLFLNLLLNAGQALRPGGRTDVGTTEDGGFAMVTIRDDGVGMTPDELAHAGAALYSSKPGGTGLGLSIARKIATAHGGELHIESHLGDGTMVQVRLPRTTDGPEGRA